MPLLALSGWHDDNKLAAAIFIPAVAYFCFTVLVFLGPIYIMHQRILREKMDLSRKYSREANRLVRRMEGSVSEEMLKRLEFVRGVIGEIRSTPNWPVTSEISLRFVITSVVIPIAVAALSGWLKGR